MNQPSPTVTTILAATILLALGGCGSDSDNTATTSATQNTSANGATIEQSGPTGIVDTATPQFVWPAVPQASTYRIVVQDGSGNNYAQEISPQNANCVDATGNCNATPDIAYYNKALTWMVESTVNGEVSALTQPVSFTTPESLDIQPPTTRPEVCDVYPMIAYDKYAVLNNIWNAQAMTSDNWQQSIAVTQDSGGTTKPSWTYDWLDASQGGYFDVKAYPEVVYGDKLGTLVSAPKSVTGLPETVAALPEFRIEFAFSETGDAERNVAIESFFHDSCDITGPCDTVDNRAYEMMVWVNNPRDQIPGDLALQAQEIDGLFWDVYIKPRSDKHYIAFTANTPMTRGTLNWKRFVDWTVQWTAENATELGIDPLTSNLCMGAIEIGTELWSGSGSFTLDNFQVTKGQSR